MIDITNLAELEDFPAIVESFKASYRRDASTLRTYENRFNRWHDFLVDVRQSSILVANGEDVKLYVEQLTNDGMMLHVRRQYVQAVKTLYAFLTSRGKFEGENPVLAYEGKLDAFDKQNARYDRTAQRVPQKDKFSKEELEKLLANADRTRALQKLRMVIDVAINTGIRVDGIGKLTLDKFEQTESGQYYIQLTKGNIPEDNDTKTHSYQVPITETFVRRVLEYVEQRNAWMGTPGDKRVFVSPFGNIFSGNELSQHFGRFIRKFIDPEEIQKRKLSIHSLRKNFGSRMLNEEHFSLLEVSKMLGHTKISTTQIYLKLSEKEVNDAFATKAKTQQLDPIEKLKAEQESRKVQKSQEEISGELKQIDSELREVGEMLLSGDGNQTHLRKREIELIREREQLTSQMMTPREQDLMQERELLLQRIKSLENQLAFASDKMKQLPNFKLYERKTKANLKEQMQTRARELAGPGTIVINKGKQERHYAIGLGEIADKINEEFNTQFTRGTIKYWLGNSSPQ